MLIVLSIFIVAITGIRLITVLGFQKPIDHPRIANGILDLQGWTIPPNKTITLNGEWEFLPNRLITPDANNMEAFSSAPERKLIQVPGAWEPYFPDGHDTSFLYGTYRLRILLDDNNGQTFQLRTNEMNNASAVFVNGQLAAGAGHPSANKDLYKPWDIPYSVPLTVDSKTIEIVIQVANHAGNGGIGKAIHFGTLQAVHHYTQLSIGLQLMLCIVLLVHSLYALMLYFLGAANKGLFYFALIMFFAIITVLGADDKLLLVWFPIPFEISVKITILSYIGVVAFLPPLLRHIFPEYGSAKVIRWFASYCSVYAMFVILSPTHYIIPSIKILGTILLIAVIVAGHILLSARKQEDVIYLQLGCISLGANIIWTILRAQIEMMHYPFDLIITVFAFAAFWFRRFFRSGARTKLLAEKLQLANQQKDDFLVNTSHELRNPLHGIINIAQSVLDDTGNPTHEDHRARLKTQVSVARRMSLLLDDLLDVARLKEKNVRLQIGNVNLQSVVAGVFEMIRYMLDGKPIDLYVDIAGNFPAVKADENRLVQIMFNVLHNAVKFTDKGNITIHADIVNGLAHIHIRDTGIGMDEETQKRIFLPYEQGNLNMTTTYGGFGLGLSICKWLVELHGGDMMVDSTLGHGSVFTFTLPLSEDAGHQENKELFIVNGHAETAAATSDIPMTTPKSSSNGTVKKPKILAVDDDSVNLKILTDILSTAQYDITTSISGSDALTKMETAHFDLIILDVMMPHLSGYELTRIIRERYSFSELPILLLTARTRSEDIVVGFQSGANDYIAKPVDSWELKYRVRALTELKLSIDERLRLEAAWLQAQIKPHFLHNTINTIAALGTFDISRMQELLEQFSNYLRASFDFHNSDRLVSIDRELALVQHYLFIEKERFGDRLIVHWNLEANLQFALPPLTIQTLVENSVIHGIMRRTQGGTIHIRIMSTEESFEISIRDNGVGMGKERIQRLFANSSDISMGIGLRNTDRRLKQLYGKGLQIQSIPDQGTTVSFQIPK
ncbi:ATP-binding protein [Paenibacillus andongensis]|uniref:ATP-binding protein n=1 Tax=Paenibacillus andongensis TaxID=2975482 RepID=UPI0021BB0BE1|nr:ATP-binding protein [Paenibacillus andongensis]